MSNKSIERFKKDIVITVKISNDDSIQKLNKKYLKKDYSTDVLSFEVGEDCGENYYLGDVIVNLDQAKRQALEYNNSIEQEISELAGHGILHLLGVHHDDDDEKTVHGVKSY